MSAPQVPPVRARTKDEVSNALASDWLRVAPLGERKSFSLKIGADEDGKTVSRAISGENLPAGHTMLNSLVADPTALFNTLRLFGGCFVPVSGNGGNDMETICAMFHAATEHLERIKDGKRCHVDTAVLAKLFAPLVPRMLAVIEEANGQERPALRAVGQ